MSNDLAISISVQHHGRCIMLKHIRSIYGTSTCPRFVFLRDLKGEEAHRHTYTWQGRTTRLCSI